MTINRNGFTFIHLRKSQWAVSFEGAHFAYVSTAAVIRALEA